jgi:molybdopterin biosynthesis enzyme
MPGEVARIFHRGARPLGADAVVMQEDVTLVDDAHVRFQTLALVGNAFVKKVKTSIKNTVLASKGHSS